MKQTKKNIPNHEFEFEGEATLSHEAREKAEEKEETFEDSFDQIYPDAEVNIARDSASAFQLKRKYDQESPYLKIDPDFQREKVWKEKQNSELIESILMGIPLPLIYVKEDKNGVYIIVDGRQRLTAIFDFMDDRFKLKKLNTLKNFNGKSFSELTQKHQNMIEDCHLTLHVIKPPTSDRVTFDLFDRVNRGGTRLNNQEMRNALYQGPSTLLLKDLSASENFRKATDNSINPQRMKDRYLILRFITFYLWRNRLLTDTDTGKKIEYRSDMEDFLGKSMLFLNDKNNREITNKLSDIFEVTMKQCFGLFGKDCFRLPKKNKEEKPRRPVNMALFETVSYFVAMLREVVDQNADLVKEKYKELINNEDYVKALTYIVDSKKSVIKRLEIIEKAIGEIQNA